MPDSTSPSIRSIKFGSAVSYVARCIHMELIRHSYKFKQVKGVFLVCSKLYERPTTCLYMQCARLRRTIAQCLFHPFTMSIIINRYHNIVRYHNVSSKEFYNNSNTTLDITLNTKKVRIIVLQRPHTWFLH
uniref:Uncharacterized protein n=2 Tax=Cacopsylla melanoneura TaxID=428564 RepID=A0A8D8ZB59_9HEMI